MNKSKKPLAMLSAAAVAGLIATAVTTPVSAKTTGIVVNGADSKVYEYNYASLKASALAVVMNGDSDAGATLYNDFISRKSGLAAFYDDVKAGYVDASVVKAAATAAALDDKPFVLDNFTSAVTTATTTVTASKVTVGDDGKIAISGQSSQTTVASVSAITIPDTIVGSVPTLPSTVDVKLNDGTTKAAAITWNTAATVAGTYASAGTVTVNGTLADYNNYSVSATVTVNGTLVVNSVSVNSATVDSTIKNKQVTMNVNGALANLDQLAAAGYTVTFTSFDSNGAASTDIFGDSTGAATTSSNSADGKLADNLSTYENKDYQVQAVVSKAGTIITSDKATIKVRNLQSAASSISTYELTNITLGAVQNSSTLAVSETANFTKLTLATGTTTSDVLAPTAVKTSNAGVISVDPTTKVITANAPGTATISVFYGDVQKDITMTVTSQKRKIAKVTPEVSTLKVIAGSTATMDVKVTDQFGDPFATVAGNAAANTVDEVVPTGDFYNAGTSNVDVIANAKGESTVTIGAVAAKTGTGTIYFKDINGNFLGSFAVTATTVNNTASSKLQVVKSGSEAGLLATTSTYSADTTLDASKDSTVRYKLANYTSEGVFAGNQALATYIVKFDKSIVNVADVTDATGLVNDTAVQGTFDTTGQYVLPANSTAFDIKGIKEGATTVSLYKSGAAAGQLGDLVGSLNITVTNGVTKITGVNWTAPASINYATTLKYTDILSITQTANDDIVNGITLSSSTLHKLRIVEASGLTQGNIYIDNDDNGVFGAGDVVVGKLAGKIATGATNLTAGSISDIIAGQAVASTDKGTLVFTITDETNADKPIISSSSVAVDVK